MEQPHAERFWAELGHVYEEAGRPTLARLVALGSEQRPPLTVSGSTVHDWIRGTSVPGRAHTPFFFVLAAYLQGRAGERSGYANRSEAWWGHLLSRAQRERAAAKGGRPRANDPTASNSAPSSLPAAPVEFTGRVAELSDLLSWLEPVDDTAKGRSAAGDSVVVVSADGMGGVGKTALALQAAHQARARGWFTGGTLFADLHGYSGSGALNAEAVVDRFLRVLGVRAKDLPPTLEEKRDQWQGILDALAEQGRPLLAVFDNVRRAEQLVGLLPARGPHRALVTSRHRLSVLPARRLGLFPLPPAEAVALLEQALRAGGTDDRRVSDDPGQALAVAEFCGRLPLALKIVAALLRDEPHRPLAAMADDLAATRTRLDVLDYDDTDPQDGRPLAVRAAFSLSYQHLTSSQRRTFHLLAAAPGPDISTASATVLVDRPGTRRSLADLARAHLIVSDESESGAERWSMHDLVRLYADEQGREPETARSDGREEAVDRVVRHYAGRAVAAITHVHRQPGQAVSDAFPDRRAALRWLDAERTVLIAAALERLGRGSAAGLELAVHLPPFLDERRDYEGIIKLMTASAHLYRAAGNHQGEASVLNNLGLALREAGRYEEAITTHEAAAEAFRTAGDLHGAFTALASLGMAFREAHRYGEAVEALTEAVAAFRAAGNDHSEATALISLGGALTLTGDREKAVIDLTRAATIFHALGDQHAEAIARQVLGTAQFFSGDHDAAIASLGAAVALFHDTGDWHSEASTLNNLGKAFQGARRYDEAVSAFATAAGILRDTGDHARATVSLTNLAIAHNERLR
ncbi:tetratricopeptide repeat protein [Streptomyces sp. NPDC088757]|uniref:tetratricopeptide repeat protein n=1 Tax=Streptomyces sp. NPDC088757 TaxID=3365889 RepID=UPI0037FFF1E6